MLNSIQNVLNSILSAMLDDYTRGGFMDGFVIGLIIGNLFYWAFIGDISELPYWADLLERKRDLLR